MAKLALVVDDSLVIRRMVGAALEKLGFEVVACADGRQALEKAAAQPFRFVITDLNMPVMNGLEFMKALRETASYRFTPVVFLTTDTDGQMQEDARQAGATAWLQKPFQADKVVQLVSRLCP